VAAGDESALVTGNKLALTTPPGLKKLKLGSYRTKKATRFAHSGKGPLASLDDVEVFNVAMSKTDG